MYEVVNQHYKVLATVNTIEEADKISWEYDRKGIWVYIRQKKI
jgi:hypothetical protein